MIKQLLILFSFCLHFSLGAQEYVKNIGNPGIDDGCTFIEIKNNTMYLAGYSAKQCYLAAYDLDGKLLWKKYFSFSLHRNFITDIIIQENHLVFCGYGHNSGTTVFDEFVVDYNFQNHKIEWARKTSLNIKPNNIHFENNTYIVTGDEYAKGKFGLCFLSIAPKNGKINNFTTWYYTGHESAAITKIDNGILYTGGRYGIKPKTDKYRASISQFKLANFEQVQSNYFLNSKQDFARAYLADFELKKDTIIAACFSNNRDITNNYSMSLLSTLKNGSVNWSYEYQVEGFQSITVRDMLAVEDGYLVLGFTKVPNENLILSKFDLDGYPEYAYVLGGQFADKMITDQGKYMQMHQGYLYIAAQTKNLSDLGDYDSFVIKIKQGDSWNDSCFQVKEAKIKMLAYEDLIEGQITMMQYDTILKEMNIAFSQHGSMAETDAYNCKRTPERVDSVQEGISFDNAAYNNTVFLMDASLSMNKSDRMPVLKQALFKILQFMRDQDKISAISYSDDAELVLDGVSASQLDEIKGKIDSLQSSGQSDLVNGLQLGVKVAEENYIAQSNNRIIITTDGDLSFDKQKNLLNLLEKHKDKDIVFTIFLFNNSSIYYEQLATIAQTVGAKVVVVNASNIEEVLLEELGAKNR